MNRIQTFCFLSSIMVLSVGCQNQQDSASYLTEDSFTQITLDTVFEFSESANVAFRSIHTIKSDEHGNVLVHDFSQPYLIMFDQDGNFLSRIGNEGRGPGEFQGISGFIVDENNLWVIDARNIKMEKFEYQQGKYVHIRTIPLGSMELTGGILGKTEEGFFINNRITLVAGSDSNPTERPISLIDENGEILVNTVFALPIEEQMRLQGLGNVFEGSLIFGNQSLMAFDGINRMYTLWTDSLSIYTYTTDRYRRHAFSHKLEPVKLTDQEKDSISRRYHIYQADLRRKLPDVKPLVNDLIMDDNQRVWVELLTENLGHGWFVFTNEGAPLYKMDIPKPGAKLQEVSGNRVYWNYVNDDGLPIFVVSNIRI